MVGLCEDTEIFYIKGTRATSHYHALCPSHGNSSGEALHVYVVMPDPEW